MSAELIPLQPSNVIPLRPDAFIPLRFEMPPEQAAEARLDYQLATHILQFAQQARNEVFQRGEALSPEKRHALAAMIIIVRSTP